MSKKPEQLSQEEAWAARKEEKRRKKELKEKKPKESEPETEAEKLRKRKREPLPDELEIDVALPEPVSKKELRKAKKAKKNPKPTEDGDNKGISDAKDDDKKEGKRSEYGVWIGNLPWSATKDILREFITSNSEISGDKITRVHMPAPTKPPNSNWTTKPLNRGFAYVDFSDELSMYTCIALTETKMDGRPLLIKNAKSFEGRPEKPKEEAAAGADGAKGVKGGNPPNKRIFVGNLSFDVTKEDLQEHYAQCGDIELVHMATFEDSGKCKGYAWVTFADVEAATSAVKGFIFKEPAKKKGDDESGDDDDVPKKPAKKQKWFVNRFMGRELRTEFAEDSTTRYNKRYGKEKKDVEGMDGLHPDRLNRLAEGEAPPSERRRPPRQFGGDKKEFGGEKKRRRDGKVISKDEVKRDPRTIKSGAAHTSAQRAPQGIVPSEGKKITFD